MVIFSKQLKAARRKLGLTQAGFAAELGVTVQAVKNWEGGRRSCKARSAARVLGLLAAHGLDLSPEQPAPQNHRPRYAVLAAGDWKAASKYGWCELKYDGHYGELHGGPDGWTVTTRRGGLILSGQEPLPVCHLLVESIAGTEWAESGARTEGLTGALVVWGALNRRGVHLSRARLCAVVDKLAAAGLPVTASERFDMADAPAVWASDVCDRGWEGLVFRTAGGRFAKMKHRSTMDYVCIRGDQGSVIGGLYNSRGQLVEKVSVPCPDPPRVGEVFEASGLAVTARGSLRNPRWERWRPDKAPEDCIR